MAVDIFDHDARSERETKVFRLEFGILRGPHRQGMQDMARDTKIGDMTRWACHGHSRFKKQMQRRRVLSLVRNVDVDM